MSNASQWGVFCGDKMDKWGTKIANVRALSMHDDLTDARKASNAARRADRRASVQYFVASSEYPTDETFAA